MKKKWLAGLLIFMMSATLFTGCGGSSDADAGDADAAVEAETEIAGATEDVNEADAAEAEDEEAEPEPEIVELGDVVLVDNEEMKVVAKSMEVFYGVEGNSRYETIVNVSVENKTEAEIIIVDYARVNGFECLPMWQFEENSHGNGLEIGAATIVDAKIRLSDSSVRATGEQVTDIVIAFESPMDYETVFESVHIYPYGEEAVVSYERPVQETDVVVVDNEQVSVILTESIKEQDYISISYYIKNKTDGDICFIPSDVFVDGEPWYFYWDEEVIPAGVSKNEYIDIGLMEEGQDVNFKEVSEVTFTFWVLDASGFTEDTYDDIWAWSRLGETDFNPENYTLFKENVVCTPQVWEEE